MADEIDTNHVLDEAALKIARETLTGDIRDLILTDLKDHKSPLPWNLRGEEAQREVIERVTNFADGLVSRIVRIVAAGGRNVVQATLAKMTVKDGIKAELELSQFDQQRHRLMDAVGASVMVVVADTEVYQGEREPVTPLKDQPEMFDPESGEIQEPDPDEIPKHLDRRSKRNGDGRPSA